MVTGVTKGFEKHLIVAGVGYKIQATDTKLTMNIGFSHPVELTAPAGITFAMAAPLEIVVKGIDRQLVGQMAATIKAAKPVEPYHGYGIHYKDEVVIRKEGKTAGK
jgi:large subunit ribosomal protein L6